MKNAYRILTFDGGGLRSIFSARLVSRILKERPDFLDKVDMIAGNSGGSIVACGLAAGYSPEEIVSFFKEDGPNIFKTSFTNKLKGFFGVLGAKYEGEPRQRVFEKYFSGKKLSTIEGKTLLLTAFDLKHNSGRWKPVSFHNYKGSPTIDYSLTDCLMASTAAPTYFPIARAGNTRYIDGGVWANNPSLAAYSEAINTWYGKQDHKNVILLNIGSIASKSMIKSKKSSLGYYDWFQNEIIDLILDSASMDSIEYYLGNIMGPNYKKLNILMDEEIKLDDFSKIDKMLSIADNLNLDDVKSWLQGFWY